MSVALLVDLLMKATHLLQILTIQTNIKIIFNYKQDFKIDWQPAAGKRILEAVGKL